MQDGSIIWIKIYVGNNLIYKVK